MEQRVEKVHANLEDELIWILEHDSVYTKGISASDKDLLLPNLFPVIATNRGGKIYLSWSWAKNSIFCYKS